LPPTKCKAQTGRCYRCRRCRTSAAAVRGFVSNPAFSLLGFLVAWQIFPHFASPFFDALLKLVHPADEYL